MFATKIISKKSSIFTPDNFLHFQLLACETLTTRLEGFMIII